MGLADRKIRKLETKGDVEGLIKCLGRRPTGGLARDALADLGAEATLEPLLAALGDESESDETRSGAAETLGMLGDRRAVEPLLSALSDLRERTLGPAQGPANALGRLGDPRAVEPLVEALEDSYSFVRWEAAHALGKLGDPRGLEPLEALRATDKNDLVRAAAESAWTQIMGQLAAANEAESAAPAGEEPAAMHLSNLLRYGLVVANPDAGTQLTEDGLLYVDGMLGDPRDCPEHPDAFADLKAVSRDRMISLNGDELTSLATIALGERFTTHVVGCAKELEVEEWANAALMNLAGAMAHGARHAKAGAWTPGAPLSDLEFSGDVRAAYERQLTASIADTNPDIRRLAEEASRTWVERA